MNQIHSSYPHPIILLILAAQTLLPLTTLAEGEANPKQSRPNIVLIISDDQAWTDYGFMGHPDVQTPKLDKLADLSLRFDRGYVATPLCRPSLASMVTGRFPAEHGIMANDVTGGMFVINEKGETVLLRGKREPLDKPVRDSFHQLPSFVRGLTESGYLTHQSGKWWEGSYADGGFTHGMTEGERHGDKGLVIGREGMEPIEQFIDHALEEEKPFFLWYAPFLPHTPHNPPDRLLEKYNKEGRALDVAKYYAMIEWFDETCGELMDIIKTRELLEETVVIYICDNGWAPASTTGDWPREQAYEGFAMRSKGSPYENGIRTPILVSWPGTVEPEKSNHFAHSNDLFPTIANLAGFAVPEDLTGINLLDRKAVMDRKAIFGSFHASHNMTVGDPDDTLQYLWCIEGDWKLILRYSGKDTTKYRIFHEWDTASHRLFNLKDDPAEKNDIAVNRPHIVERLRKKIEEWHSAQAPDSR
ncbi:MAG: sulfatase-like hydrolase/transferase [Puniceicoccaceae bacterium]